jgi:hypothetical protein
MENPGQGRRFPAVLVQPGEPADFIQRFDGVGHFEDRPKLHVEPPAQLAFCSTLQAHDGLQQFRLGGARFQPGGFHPRLHLKLALKADGVAPSRTLGAQDAEVEKRLGERGVAPQGQQEQAHGALQALFCGGGGLISSLKGR